jgi:acyl-CoA dehydrogenase
LYLPHSPDAQLARIEDALQKVIKAEHAERRLRKDLQNYAPDYHGLEGLLAAGLKQRIISNEEAQLIREADAARSEVIQVDDFTPDLT